MENQCTRKNGRSEAHFMIYVQSDGHSDLVNPNALVPKKFCPITKQQINKSRNLSTDNVVCEGCKSSVISTQLRQV